MDFDCREEQSPNRKEAQTFRIRERERESITNPPTLGEEFANKYAAHGEKTIQHIISPFSTIRQTFSSSKPSSNFLFNLCCSQTGVGGRWEGWTCHSVFSAVPSLPPFAAAVVRSNGDSKGQKTFFLFSPC